MDYDEPIEPVEDVLRDIRSELQEINRELQEINSECKDSAIALNKLSYTYTIDPNYHLWFFILTVMVAALLYRLW